MEKYVRKLQLIELDILKEVDRICRENDIKYFIAGGTLLGAIRHKGFIPWDDDIDIAMTRKNYDKFIKICPKEIDEKFFVDNYQTNKKCALSYTKIKRKNTLFVETKNKDCYDEKSCIWIDVFPLDGVKENGSKTQKMQRTIWSYITTLITIKVGTNFYQNSKIKKKIYGIILKFIPQKVLTKILDMTLKLHDEDKVKWISCFPTVYTIEKDTFEIDKLLPYKDVEFEGCKFMGLGGYDYYLTKMYNDYMKLPPKEKRVNHAPYLIKFEGEDEIIFDAGVDKSGPKKQKSKKK